MEKKKLGNSNFSVPLCFWCVLGIIQSIVCRQKVVVMSSFEKLACRTSGARRLKLVGTHCFGVDYDNGGEYSLHVSF